MLVKIYPDNPSTKALDRVASVLEGGGVIVYPTDTVYAFGCSVKSPKAVERLRAIRHKEEGALSIVCDGLASIADYGRVDTPTFKLLKRNLPGPFTFILKASGRVPDKCLERRKTIGVRVPAHPVARALATRLGHPLVTASVREEDEAVEYTTDPELIAEKYGARVDLVVDGGIGRAEVSTVVDCTDGEPVVVRRGLGELIW